MSLASEGIMSRRWRDCAARRRCLAKRRAKLLRILGWTPEIAGDPGDRYVATSGELARWAREKLASCVEGT